MLNVLNDKQQTELEIPARPVGSPTELARMRIWLDERIAKGKKSPHAEVVALTPVLASLLLERNPVNRPIGRYNKDVLMSDIANKRFLFNGETIVVSDTGFLIDGQHRCAAVLETKQAITLVMVFGPKEEARYTIDIGKPKTASNFLHMQGHVDTNNLSATLSLLVSYSKHGTLTPGLARATKTEILASVDNYRGVELSLRAVGDGKKCRLGSRSALAFCHYTFKKRAGADAANDFFQKLIDGDGLRKGNPIYYCRERLIGMDRGTRAEVRSELIFRAWNAWRRGETPTSMKLTGSLPKLER